MLSEKEIVMLHNLVQEQKLSPGKVNINSLSRQTDNDRKTILKYICCPRSRQHNLHHPKRSKFDFFKEYLKTYLDQYPTLSSDRLLEEVKKMDYSGGYIILKDYIQKIHLKRHICFSEGEDMLT